MDDKKQFSRRLLAIGVLFSLVLAAYFVTLFDAQIVQIGRASCRERV